MVLTLNFNIVTFYAHILEFTLYTFLVCLFFIVCLLIQLLAARYQ